MSKNLSAREKWAKKTGRPKEEYEGGNSDKKKKNKKKKYSSILDSVLANTPAQQPVQQTFEEFYTAHPELQAEDLAQAENQIKPAVEQKIQSELEDLNLWTQSNTADYTRSLRRARATMAVQGGAIGSERTTTEGEMQSDFDLANKVQQKGTAQQVGTERMNQAGYNAYNTPTEGALPASQKTQIADWTQWYKEQRSNRYWSDVNTLYKQPTNTMLK